MCNRFSSAHRWAHAQHKYNKFGHKAYRKWGRHKRFGRGMNHPPVNVRELDDRYELYVFAPGLAKSDFQIGLVDRILSIAVEPQEDTNTEETFNWRRREFRQRGFKRQFELNEGIDTSLINAQYEEGILQITLPKLEEFHTERQDIVVA